MNALLRKLIKGARLARVPAYRGPLRLGVGAAIEHEPVLRFLAADGVRLVLDVGANVGQFALAARHCIPEARIDSFEPLAGPAATFRRVFAGDGRVTLHACALGPEASTAEMHVSAADDSSSLLPIGQRQEAIFPGTGEVGRERVRVATLDSEIAPPDPSDRALLKIDVQGFELPALRGCESLLPLIRWVYVEASFMELYEGQGLAHEVIDHLHGRGFELRGIYLPTYDSHGLAVQGDLLFGLRAA